MKKVLSLLMMILCFQVAKAQTITARVIDALNNKPLSYAIVLYHNQQRVIYTDVNGYFTVATDSLLQNDVITIQFIGYKKLILGVNDLKNKAVFAMVAEEANLQPVIVSNCRKTEDFLLNKKTGRIKQYIGPGPETKLVIIARYNNNSGRTGWLKKVSILIDEKSPNLQIPIRLRWYEWDLDKKMPGKELTDTNIIVFPYKEGWNDFEIPERSIQCPKDWLVFGLEFIYPPEYKEQFETIKTDSAKISWLSDMQNRWSLAMQYVRDENETGFYIINNDIVNRYSKKYDRFFVRPALKFSIVICAE